jgi:hypothetical protein
MRKISAIKKFNPLLFLSISCRSDKSLTFSTTREAEQISSVANECKNVISFSIFFAGGEVMEWKTDFKNTPWSVFVSRSLPSNMCSLSIFKSFG